MGIGPWREEEKSNYRADVPVFERKLDSDAILEWLTMVERVFDFLEVGDEMNVKLVGIELRGYASTWWGNLGIVVELGKERRRFEVGKE